MAESDNYMRLVGELQTDEHIKQTLEEMESFYSYEEYMGVFSKKKLLLKTREEMKFEIANSNLH